MRVRNRRPTFKDAKLRKGVGWLVQLGRLGQRRREKELGAYEQVRASWEEMEDEATLDEAVLAREVDALGEAIGDLWEVVADWAAQAAMQRGQRGQRPQGRLEQRSDQEKP